MELVETYTYVDQPPLEADILAIGGTEDSAVSPTALAEWRRHTARRFAQRLLPGGHFLLFSDAATINMIAGKLAPYVKV